MRNLIAANWKMHKTRAEARDLARALADALAAAPASPSAEVVLFPPFTAFEAVREGLGEAKIGFGGQDVYPAESGAFTGEISPGMLLDAGCSWVLTGHSERRQYFGETDVTVQKRVRAALDAGLKVILCIGELLEQREAGITEEIVGMQTKVALGGVTKAELGNIILAYEPVWAIGTGKTATAEQANEVNHYIRTVVEKLYDKEAADGITIQYGGSMNAKNAEELLDQEDVDGGLIGGASLKAPDFAAIVKAASR